ncbi:MAG: hypothetical protein KDA20_08015 [Phycisphaerales bacterium]|nr:hypothetical protein [Phycisphaerales bacterium]
MNVTSFLEHWGLKEHPFRAEEARHDPVFARLSAGPMAHPDIEKLAGDLHRPASGVVFGEKGAGKTAMRMQLEGRIEKHNADADDGERLFVVRLDDLNGVLDRFSHAVGIEPGMDDKSIVKKLSKFRLSDHIDAILHGGVSQLCDAILGVGSPAHGLSSDTARRLRWGDVRTRSDVMLLAALYDRSGGERQRMAAIRRRARGPRNGIGFLFWLGVWFGWLPAAALVATFIYMGRPGNVDYWLYGLYALLGLWGLVLIKCIAVDRTLMARTARKLSKQLRVTPKRGRALSHSLALVPSSARQPESLPFSSEPEIRLDLLRRFLDILRAVGCKGMIVIIDRVDEPALLVGDAARMRAVIWPLFSNTLLQVEGLGVKMLLPIELRHELMRESASFFQEARLDKQSLVERLAWSGAMLYDLCNARLRACLHNDVKEPGPALTDLFDEAVTRQDLVDALDQMAQPRDAFKMLYQCLAEHCSNVTEEQAAWRIPRLVLETVRKQQAERVQMLHRGLRPA